MREILILREIYLDNSATTATDADIAQVALNAMLESYGNPSSQHKKGIEAHKLLESSREKLAAAFGCEAAEIVFTSGGTEANNLAIFGAVRARKRVNAVVSTAWEHSSVLEPLKRLEKEGKNITLIKPGADGKLDIERLAGAVGKNTALVSCMMVNSEVGHIADIAALAKLARGKNPDVLIHCDAVQAFGKLKFSAKRFGVDLLSVSGHKLHAPKGVGALFVNKKARIQPMLFGGGQERTLRPGTEAIPLIAAFGAAAEKAVRSLDENHAHVTRLREYFVKKAESADGLCMNSPADASPYICNVSVPGYRSEILLRYLADKGIYVSSGSACGRGKPSHMLAAMGLPARQIDSALRVSFSKNNETADVDTLFTVLAQAMKEIRA